MASGLAKARRLGLIGHQGGMGWLLCGAQMELPRMALRARIAQRPQRSGCRRHFPNHYFYGVSGMSVINSTRPKIQKFCKAVAANRQMEFAPASPGVYVIVNTVTMRAYIGKSVNVERRWRQHRRYLSSNKHHNTKLQADWNTYGETCFKFSVFSSAEAADIGDIEESAIGEILGDACYNWSEGGGLGRPPLPADQQTKIRTIRLTDAHFAKLKAIGMDRLRAWIDKAKVRE